jgi:broad specificity phosphatase PhoE
MSLICFYLIQGGGESLEQLYIRAQSAMEEIAEKHHGMSSSTTAMFGNSN